MSIQQVVQEGDKDLWRRVVSVEEHEKYQNKYLAYRHNKTKLESYKATKADLISDWNNGYTEAASKVLERWGKCVVKKVLIMRTFQSNCCSSYNEFNENSMTADNCDRIARSMKRDELFTTALWFQLDERLWVSVEKKDVIHMKTMPSKYLC